MPHLFHNNADEIRLLDCEGRTHIIPPHKAWRVPDLHSTDCDGTRAYVPITTPAEKMVKYYLREGIHYGLVEVRETVTDNGITFDLADAARRSTAAREHDKTEMLERYVFGAKDDEMKKEPVKPPPDVIKQILVERGLDLIKDFGVRPVGYASRDTVSEREKDLNQQLLEQQAKHEAEVAELRGMMARILANQETL